MKENYTIALRVFVLLVVLSITHTAAKILGSLGVISDLFVVLGAYQVWLNVKSPVARQNLIEQFKGYTNLDDISELLAEKTEELKVKFDEVKKEVRSEDQNVSEEIDAILDSMNSLESEVKPIDNPEANIRTFKDGDGI